MLVQLEGTFCWCKQAQWKFHAVFLLFVLLPSHLSDSYVLGKVCHLCGKVWYF